MEDRIQRVLDGALPREALEPAERSQLEAYEEAIERALASGRAETAPDVTARVMGRVEALPRHRGLGAARASGWRRALAWFWSPRTVRLRPAWALAAVALAALLLVPGVGPDAGTAPAIDLVATAPADAPVFVHFRLDAAGARSVQLAADFTGWEPRFTLREALPGVWTVVVPVETGVHQYAFVVDGERWVADPLAPPVADGFGGTNSRLDVVRPESRRAL